VKAARPALASAVAGMNYLLCHRKLRMCTSTLTRLLDNSKIISSRCHPERGDSRARDLTTADAVDVVNGSTHA
jgi:hypothetical protein